MSPARAAPLLAVLAGALALRLAHVADFRHSVAFRAPLVDAFVYDRDARRVAADGPTALELPYYQPPAYTLLLGAVYAVTGGSWTAPRLLQALAGALTVLLVFRLAMLAAGARAAWIAAALLAACGPMIYFETELLPPAWILLLDTAATLLVVQSVLRGDPRARPAAAALLLGTATAMRPTSALLAAGLAIWRLRQGRLPGRSIAVAAAAFVLPWLPFTAANLIGGGEPVLISWNGGINLYVGNGAHADSLAAIQPGYAWDRLQREPLRAGVTTRAGESSYWTRRALREAAAQPAAWAGALGRKALRLLAARETPRNTDWEAFRRDSRVLALPLVGFGLLAPLAFLGLAARGPDRRVVVPVAIAAACLASVNLIFFVADRYRLETYPFLAVLAGAGVAGVLSAGVRAVSPRAMAMVVALTVLVHADLLGEREPDPARDAINRGVMMRRSGLDAGAAREFRAALAVSPDDPDAHRWLGEMALGAGQPAEALAHFDASLARAPDYLRVLLARAAALQELGRDEEAERTFRTALDVDPWSTDARLNYGVFLAVAGRTGEARAMFEQGLRLDPADGRLARNLERLERGS